MTDRRGTCRRRKARTIHADAVTTRAFHSYPVLPRRSLIRLTIIVDREVETGRNEEDARRWAHMCVHLENCVGPQECRNEKGTPTARARVQRNRSFRARDFCAPPCKRADPMRNVTRVSYPAVDSSSGSERRSAHHFQTSGQPSRTGRVLPLALGQSTG